MVIGCVGERGIARENRQVRCPFSVGIGHLRKNVIFPFTVNHNGVPRTDTIWEMSIRFWPVMTFDSVTEDCYPGGGTNV